MLPICWAGLGAFVSTLLLGPFVLWVLRSLKVKHSTLRTEGCDVLEHRHRHKMETPTMGGILFIGVILLNALFWLDFQYLASWILVATTLLFGLIGFIDDYRKITGKKGIRSKHKFLTQSLFAFFICAGIALPCWLPSLGLRFPTMVSDDYYHLLCSMKFPFIAHSYSIPFVLFIVFSMFVIVGTSNAVNLTDGLDGLAVGMTILVALGLGVVAYQTGLLLEGNREVLLFLALTMGSCLGFLWFNVHPAQMFMGDTGSLALGALLGVCSILIKQELFLSIAGGVFVAETLSVMIQVWSYRMRKKRVFLCSPLHHHFEYLGWTESQIVLRFWIIGILCSVVGLLAVKGS